MSKITVEQIRQNFKADFETGEIFNIKTGRKLGHEVPVTKDKGLVYLGVHIKNENGKFVRVYAHRVIYALYHGELPNFIDHKDGNPFNNSISNLTGHVSQAANMRNRVFRKQNPYGIGIAMMRNRKTGVPQYWRVGVAGDVEIHKVGAKSLADVQAIALQKYRSKGFTPRHYASLVEAMTANTANNNYEENKSTGA